MMSLKIILVKAEKDLLKEKMKETTEGKIEYLIDQASGGIEALDAVNKAYQN